MKMHTGMFVTGVVFLAVGVAFVLEAYEVWTLRFADLRVVGPLVLVGIGVAVVIGALTRRNT